MTGPLDRLPEHPDSQAYPVAWVSAYPSPPLPDLLRWSRVVRARRKTVLWTFLAIVGIALVGVIVARPVYMAKASVVVVQRQGGMAIMQDMPLLNELFNLGGGSSVDTQVAVLNSRDLQAGALKKCGLEGEDPRRYLEVESVPNTDVIEIRARARTRALAKRLASALVQDYLRLTAQMASSVAGEAARFVGEQLDQVHGKLDKALGALKDFQEKSGLVAPDAQTNAMVQKYADMRKDYLAAIAEGEATAKQVNEQERLLGQTERTVIASVNTAPSPVLDYWEGKLADLEAQRAAALQEYQPGSERVRALDEQIADARKRILDLVKQQMHSVIRGQQETINPLHEQLLEQSVLLRAQNKAARTRQNVMKQALRQADAQLITLPEKQQRYAQYMADVVAYKQLYGDLMNKREELRIGAEASQPSARLLDEPKSGGRPVSPRRGLTLVVAAIVGLILGLLLAAGQEYLDTTVKTTGEVERSLGAPVLGHVPLVTRPVGSLSGSQGPAPFVEAYRIVRSNIERSGEAPVRSVMLTSAGPDEGKSLTAVNLAVAVAKRGRSVILVDADLRKPAIHERLGLDNQRGLAEVLSGEASLQEALRETDVPGLRVLTSGQPRPDAADLLTSPRLGEALASLREMADLIVIDTPPALALADAMIVAPHVDGVIVVVGSRAATQQALVRVRQVIDGAHGRVLGAVVNKVDFQRDGLYDEQLHYLADYYYRRKGRSSNPPSPPADSS